MMVLLPSGMDSENAEDDQFWEEFESLPPAERLKNFERFIKEYPSNQHIWYKMAYVAEDLKKYNRARYYYERCIELDPKLVHISSAYFNLALLLERYLKDYANARLNYLNAITVNEQHNKAYNNLGMLLFDHFAEPESARYYYLKGLSINSDDSNLHHNLSYLLTEEFKDYSGAYIHLTQALELDPNNEDIQYSLKFLVDEYLKPGG